MVLQQVQQGKKVQPVDNEGLRRSEVWKQAQRLSQPFLFVLKVNNCVLLGLDRADESGGLFDAGEIELYQE